MPSGPWCALPVEKEQRWLPRLAPQLPLPIPVPVAQGEPADGYPYPWSVYGWLDGDVAMHAEIADLTAFATAVAGFLAALQRIYAADGPGPGEHNFFRGDARLGGRRRRAHARRRRRDVVTWPRLGAVEGD